MISCVAVHVTAPTLGVLVPQVPKAGGVRRLCWVIANDHYVTMTMGDRHATSSKVTILKKEFWSEGIY